MTAIATVLPILPGKTEAWKQLIAEVTGPRLAENADFHRRMGVNKANWFLQSAPGGDLAIVYLEGENPETAFRDWAVSRHPFDMWFKEQLSALYGIDLNVPPAGPLSEEVFDWKSA